MVSKHHKQILGVAQPNPFYCVHPWRYCCIPSTQHSESCHTRNHAEGEHLSFADVLIPDLLLLNIESAARNCACVCWLPLIPTQRTQPPFC